ncbi:MAG TPA: alpha/beta hydrolase [Calditrichaeota bacterium]|nr:alpha/beta hydrolase [Calditrichota bacterium]
MINLSPVLRTIIVLILLYALYTGILFLLQRWFIYPGQFIKKAADTVHLVPGVRQIWLDIGSNGKVEAWYRETADTSGAAQPIVFIAHGNYELIDDNVQDILAFNEMGCAVLAVEYPGYGRSGGKPSKETITAAFLTAYDWIQKQKENIPRKIILYGRSLGGGAVCALTQRRRVDAVILQSTFSRLRDFARHYMAPGFLLRDDFDNVRALKDYEGPLLILHGRNDDVIPFYHGRRLADAFPRARFVASDFGHNDFPFPYREIQHFLQRNNILVQ